eukprot:SRR837773.15275.p1 GENE.SRR837773.15275~~SRR837773.15275.p1  ORF type:complete len:322 (-),score=99.76 SRR837773.15275:231-1139(-)
MDDLRSLAPKRPGYRRQLRILTLRRLVQWWRMNQQRAIFLGALSLGGIVLAVLDGIIVQAPRWDAMTYLNLHTALALLLSIFCLSVFGNDQPVFWRESASGINVQAYFNAKVFVNTVDIIIQTFLFTSIYFLIRQPLIPYWEFIIPFFFTSYVASGWGLPGVHLRSAAARPLHRLAGQLHQLRAAGQPHEHEQLHGHQDHGLLGVHLLHHPLVRADELHHRGQRPEAGPHGHAGAVHAQHVQGGLLGRHRRRRRAAAGPAVPQRRRGAVHHGLRAARGELLGPEVPQPGEAGLARFTLEQRT